MTAWLTVISGLFAIIIGLWKFVRRFRNEKKKRAEEAQKKIDESIKNGDTSSITAALDRLNR